jgi:Tfp pilus assembly protein PilO
MISVILAVLLGISIYMFPVLKNANEIRKKHAQKKQLIQQVKFKQNNLEVINKKIEKLKTEIGNFDNEIPPRRSFSRLWKQMASIMNLCGLTEQTVQPGTEEDRGSIVAIPIKINCTGRFEDIYKFFKYIENFERVIKFENIQLISVPDSMGIVKMDAKAEVYYIPDQKERS